MEKVHTPALKSIKELADAFDISEHDTVKTMVGKTPEGRLVFFCVPGDRELNPVKARQGSTGGRAARRRGVREVRHTQGLARPGGSAA